MLAKSMRVFWLWVCAFWLVMIVVPQEAGAANPTPLRFTYWGSDVEKAAIQQMVAAFEHANPDIDVEAIHIPRGEYNTRVTAMMRQGATPDVGYCYSHDAPFWAREGTIMDLTDLIRNDPLLAATLPEAFYYYAPGKILGVNTAIETSILFYQRDLFVRAGLPEPPTDPQNAWTWDEFVAVATRLTEDVNGKHPDEPGFDPQQIATYGFAFDKSVNGWGFYPFLFSNGAQISNADGTRLLLDSPEAIDAVQKLADLIWVHHVTPTPQQEQNLPPALAMLQTGNLAMHVTGHWNLLDYAAAPDANVGVAVLPRLKKPATIMMGSPTVIFTATQHLEAAVRFYKFHNNPEAVDLFARGLWMPLQKQYYTDPEKMRVWLDNPVHPAQSWPVFTDYTLCCAVQGPSYYLRSYPTLIDKALEPAFSSIWRNEATAEDALKQAVQTAQPFLQGRWDQ